MYTLKSHEGRMKIQSVRAYKFPLPSDHVARFAYIPVLNEFRSLTSRMHFYMLYLVLFYIINGQLKRRLVFLGIECVFSK